MVLMQPEQAFVFTSCQGHWADPVPGFAAPGQWGEPLSVLLWFGAAACQGQSTGVLPLPEAPLPLPEYGAGFALTPSPW